MIFVPEDDFDPAKIAGSGQCFRVAEPEEGCFRFPMGERVLYITKRSDGGYDAECSDREWKDVWAGYFDMSRSYSDIRRQVPQEDAYLTRAALSGAGIRILRQNKWEMLVSFIISQRKSIPAIRTSIERLCERFGRRESTRHETLYTFPTPQALCNAAPEVLAECGLGYRVPYVCDAAQRVNCGELDLDAMEQLEDGALIEKLKTVHGVGDKVANCVALFAYGRMACAPVDVWISRVIENEYHGESPFVRFADNAGILQQYMFYDAIVNK